MNANARWSAKLNLTREHEVAAKNRVDRSKPQRGVTEPTGRAAAGQRQKKPPTPRPHRGVNDRRREQAAHLQGVADDARAVAAMVEHTLHDVAAKRDELQAAASSHDEELKACARSATRSSPRSLI